MIGNRPMGVNSVTPIPNAPMASASKGQLKPLTLPAVGRAKPSVNWGCFL